MSDIHSIHGLSVGDVVTATNVSGSKAIDQSSDDWEGNAELGQDEIFPFLQEGTELEVTSIREKVGRGSGILVHFKPTSDEIPSYKKVMARTYESWPDACRTGRTFDADGHISHYSDKYFDVE